MPRQRRSIQEVESIRQAILTEALALIIDVGYDGFSMRKLAKRLDIAAKTIYNYFRNQDELYLGVLTQGFKQFGDTLLEQASLHDEPQARLEAAIRAYVDFGLDNPEIYSLMFTWHVPKYNDYVGTPMEAAGRKELETALKSEQLFSSLIHACVGETAELPEGSIHFEIVHLWIQMHGYVAGINSSLLDYLHPTPRAIKEDLVQRIFHTSLRAIERLQRRGEPRTG